MDRSLSKQQYSHGYGASSDHLALRTPQTYAAFFIEHLSPRMNLLDCGSGPGSTTVGFADIVAPGRVEGIDIDPAQVECARALAERRRVENVRFQAASIYDLPFEGDLFDAAFAHTVLQHLSDPVAALKEMHRVLKPGGIIGLREEDWGSFVIHPSSPLTRETFDLFHGDWQLNGGNPFLPRQYKELLRKAGFRRSRMTASLITKNAEDGTEVLGQMIAPLLLEPEFADRAVERGLATRKRLESMNRALVDWGAHQDAFYCLTFCEAVAWKQEAP